MSGPWRRRRRSRAGALAAVVIAASLPGLGASAAEDATITTVVVGGGDDYGDGGPAVDANLDGPRMVAFDGEGGYYLADTFHHVIRYVDADGIITTVAGTGRAGFRDGPGEVARFDAPHSVAVDAAGNVIVGDPMNNRVRRFDPRTGEVTTIAGTGERRYGGDGGPALEADLKDSKVAIVGPDDAIYVADMGNYRIRRIDPETGIIDTWAGNGEEGSEGDGGDAREASLQPRNIAFAPDHDLLVADRAGQRVRRIDWDTRIITHFAGDGTKDYDGDGGPATEAALHEVRGLGADWMGNIYLADSKNDRVRRVDSQGIIETVVGSGDGRKVEGRPPREAGLSNPRHVIFDAAGNMFITDTGSSRILEIENFVPSRPADPEPTTTTTAPADPDPGPEPEPEPQSGSRPGAVTPSGYWMLQSDGQVHPFGDATHHGDGPPGSVDLEPNPTGDGYWALNAAGRVFAYGDATGLGGVDGSGLEAGEAVTSLSATPSGQGYWVFTNRGRVVIFGDAVHLGDMAGTALNGPVLDSVPTPSGQGYYMVGSDGGIFAFGDAAFHGSMGGVPLNAAVESLVPDDDGVGYWLVASDGGVFAFDAPFRGSMGSVALNRPVTGMVAFGDGYLMVGADGGIFNFSDRDFHGSLGGDPPVVPIVAVAALG